MGKRVKFLLAGVVLMVCFYMQGMVSRAEETPSIDQVFVNLPEVTVYGSDWPEGELEAFLGQEKLTYAGKRTFAETGEPVYYYILLDVSNSMPDTYFQAVKQAIVSFEGRLNEQDRMALYTFGETVELKLAEDHGQADTAAVLESVTNADKRTLLFEAIRSASSRADRLMPEVCKRKVILVISDGEDFNIGNTGANEAKDCLRRTGIPAYAFAMKDTARENINSFGEFARNSGGTLTVFDQQQAPTLLDSFPAYIAAGDVLEWRSGNNWETNQLEAFSVRTASNQTVSRDVMVSRHIKDLDPPELVSVEQLGDNQIAVIFSEKVEGAETSSNYIITKRGREKKDEGQEGNEEVITVLSVAADKEAPYRMILSFADNLKPGEYKVGCVGIVDSSMEKNAVDNELEFEVDPLPLPGRILQGVKDWYWIGIILAVLVLAAVVARGYRKVKKGRGVVYVDGKPVMASEVEVHKHVAIQEQEGKKFYLRVSVKGNRPEDMALHMRDSFIVGRSQICNLYFDDKRMSRQHFALEWDGQNMYVTDLETTNGTLVNRVQIHERRRLQQEDVISAGSVEMTIRW